MRVAIAAAGTEGDLQPLLAIGRGLRERGHEVRFAAPPVYHELVSRSLLEPLPLGDYDPRRVVADILRSNPRRSRLLNVRRLLTAEPASERMLAQFVSACAGADAVIYTPIAGLAYHAAEAVNAAAFEVDLVPLTPTREFPSPHAPALSGRSGPLGNLISHYGVSQLVWFVNRRWVNEWRQRILGLAPLSLKGATGTPFFRKKRYAMCAVSPSVVPPPRDWPKNARVTGYLFAASETYSPPPALVEFLEAGEAPVCVSFGSTIEVDPEALRPILMDAQARTGRRLVCVKGWANYRLPEPSRNVFIVDRASYPWLYPRTSAVLHHVGTGTAAEAVRAGVPSVCVPHITEQRFWAARLNSLGVAPPQIPRRTLTGALLAAAITAACTTEMRARAEALGAKVRAEDGLTTAVTLVERVVGETSTLRRCA